MSSKNKFDQTLSQYRGIPDQYFGRDVGIEIELEGLLGLPTSPLWTTHNEGSLRDGGMEYVLKQPLAYPEVAKALSFFDSTMAKGSPKTSIRTSTHIHINVMSLTIREIYHVMAAYYLLEEMFVHTQSVNRHANLFCLTMSKAEDIFASIIDSLRGEYVFAFHNERNRYAALNLVATTKYGSLEFRFLDAMTKGIDIQRWVDIFYNLVHNAKKINPRQLLDMYDAMTAKEFVSTLLNAELAEVFFARFTRGEITGFLHTNYDYIFELCEHLKKKRFQMPKKFWNEDLENGYDPYSAYGVDFNDDVFIPNPIPAPTPHSPSPWTFAQALHNINTVGIVGTTGGPVTFDDVQQGIPAVPPAPPPHPTAPPTWMVEGEPDIEAYEPSIGDDDEEF